MRTRTFLELHRLAAEGMSHPIVVCVEQILTIQPGSGTACITLADATHFWTAETAGEIMERLRLVGCRVATPEALT